jgi:hypothetical protein
MGRKLANDQTRLKNIPTETALPILQESQFRRQCSLRTLCSVGHKIHAASTTTKAMRKQFGRGRPHQIRQPNDRERHSIKFTAVTLVIQIPALTEIRCAV